MDQIWQAVILGIIQGLTEFLPISSSAHLLLLPWIAGWESLGIMFDVLLHAGTLLAVILHFRDEIKEMIEEFFDFIRPGKSAHSGHNLLLIIIIGTIPAGLAALVFRNVIEDFFRTPAVTVVTLSLFGILLFWMDRRGLKNKSFSQISWKTGLLVGLAQAVALIPGVSRSGITITMGLFLGFSRKDSARFSFLLSFPILVLGALDGILELVSYPGGTPARWVSLAAGVTVSFVTGFFCIKFFLKYLENRSFAPFVIYRIVLAGVILTFIISEI